MKNTNDDDFHLKIISQSKNALTFGELQNFQQESMFTFKEDSTAELQLINLSHNQISNSEKDVPDYVLVKTNHEMKELHPTDCMMLYQTKKLSDVCMNCNIF